MNITTLKGPVSFAADIERQIYDKDIRNEWREHFNIIWTSIGQHHYIVATQLNEEFTIQYWKARGY